MSLMFSFLKKYRVAAILALLMMLIELTLELIQPYLISKIIDDGISKQYMPAVWLWGGILVGGTVIAFLAGIFSSFYASYASQGLGYDLRDALYRKVQSFSYSLFGQFATSSLITRLTNDVTILQDMLFMGLRFMLRMPLLVIGSSMMALIVNVKLGLLLVVGVPILLLFVMAIMKRAAASFERVQRRLDTVNNVMQENLTGMRLIRVFVRKQHERRRFEQHSSELMNDTVSALRLTETTMPFILFIMNASIIAVLWFGHRDILTGSASVGEVVAIINYSMRTMGALSAFSMIVASFSRARASAGRMDEVLTAEEAVHDAVVAQSTVGGQVYERAEQRNKRATRLDKTSTQSDQVAMRSDQASAQTNQVAMRPDQASAQTNQVAVRPDQASVQANQVDVQPEQASVQADQAAGQSTHVAARSNGAAAKSHVETVFRHPQPSASVGMQAAPITIQSSARYGEATGKDKHATDRAYVARSQQQTRDRVVFPGQTGHAAEVELQGVHFRYPDTERPILKDISFVARPGRMTAIMGATGSGKSSLIQLMLRLYDPNAGTICMDGQDIRLIEEHELRNHIGYVPQEIVLFTGTIRENIAWGNEHATLDEIQEAARIAQIHDTIVNLPGGYETRLGQRGVNLSGGQKQRLSIARALVRKPSLLLLDDSTSALDVRTEAKLLEELGQLSCTTVLITQKISSTIRADKVLLLQDGRLIAEGGHEQLLQASELYRRIYASQFGEEELQHVEGVH
ncbi:ABC transporter ATP-binding protein [Paenibacillus wenxiniae]|uniref:ABC transporter transmembrane domain-containing protein n=1 Tax=Paenibacillus wenxiniae TaxID=1636843 RepID=A0ABW4RLJ5_9BACL